jgi:hypothetical protein
VTSPHGVNKERESELRSATVQLWAFSARDAMSALMQ